MSMVNARAETIGKPIAKTAKASLLGSLISTLQSEDYLSKRDRSLRLSTRHDGPFKKKKKKKGSKSCTAYGAEVDILSKTVWESSVIHHNKIQLTFLL